MKELDSNDFKEQFLPVEGSISMIYGLIGSGKTTEGVRRIVEALQNGRIVYSNIPLIIKGLTLDERKKRSQLLLGTIFAKKYFYDFDISNYHYVEVDDFENTAKLVAFLSELKDCLIVWDEGWYLFDSYEGTDFAKSKRTMILHTRHHSRELVVIAQRPSSIQVTARGMVNRFFKCEKVLQMRRLGILILRVTEIQEMTVQNSMPDEEKSIMVYISLFY